MGGGRPVIGVGDLERDDREITAPFPADCLSYLCRLFNIIVGYVCHPFYISPNSHAVQLYNRLQSVHRAAAPMDEDWGHPRHYYCDDDIAPRFFFTKYTHHNNTNER